ncbi:MAG: hypothetical protein LBP51_06620 [Deferribacteraceae bacterium]|nr:hypothetical protein [Deferribacteraceae bacterium]
MGVLRSFLAVFLLVSFIAANAVSYSFIALSVGHVGADHHEDCDTCKKINAAVANLTHSVSILTPETAFFIEKELNPRYLKTLSDQHIAWVHTLIASKVQLNC